MDVVGETDPADQHCSLTLSSIDGAGGFNKDRNCLILVLQSGLWSYLTVSLRLPDANKRKYHQMWGLHAETNCLADQMLIRSLRVNQCVLHAPDIFTLISEFQTKIIILYKVMSVIHAADLNIKNKEYSVQGLLSAVQLNASTRYIQINFRSKNQDNYSRQGPLSAVSLFASCLICIV